MDETLTLAFELLRQDAQEMTWAAANEGKGKQREGIETDSQLALRLFQEELQNATTSLADERMATSIGEAVQLDGGAVLQIQREERTAREDHQLSIALENGETKTRTSQTNANSPMDDDEFVEKLACMYGTGIDNNATDRVPCIHDETVAGSEPESSAWAASRQPRMRECEACGDKKHFAELARAPCQHEYCRQCLTHIFRAAAADESLFPPRCCKQPIPLEKSWPFLDVDVIQQYHQKAAEFSSPRRVYCYNCSTFIPSANQPDVATCADCGCRTCVSCKGAQHGGDCPKDEMLQQVIQLARDEGWQRCQNCWGMVELKMGCYHITCRCGFQFCYVCGANWKSCDCARWDEHRLLERAVEVDVRDDHHEDQANLHEMAERVRQTLEVWTRDDNFLERIRQMAENLNRELDGQEQIRQMPETGNGDHDGLERVHQIVENLNGGHDCEHRHWSCREGQYYCEQCARIQNRFIFECDQCRVLACAYCRRHRI